MDARWRRAANFVSFELSARTTQVPAMDPLAAAVHAQVSSPALASAHAHFDVRAVPCAVACLLEGLQRRCPHATLRAGLNPASHGGDAGLVAHAAGSAAPGVDACV